MKPMTRSAHRPAFTLIELLVVMALIVTLAAITVGAVFRVQAAQRKSTTEATLQKIDSLLVQKLKTIQEQCRDRIKPIKGRSEADTMAGGGQNTQIGDAILMYLHTKNQLPMSFAEATSPTTFGSITLTPSPVFTGAQPPLVTGTGPPGGEAAVCLFLALSPLGNTGLEQQIGEVTINGVNRKCYIDSFGEPLTFNRLAFDGDNGELKNPPFVKGGIEFDPFYPKPNPQAAGTYLSLANDIGAANANALWDVVTTNVPVWAAVPGQRIGATPAAYPGLRNHTAAIISTGANKLLAEAGGVYSGDNLVSYRLRKDGGRGD